MSDDLQEEVVRLQEQRRLAEQRLCALLQALPPLHGDLTESEIACLRMLRAVSDRTFGVIVSFMEDMLLRDAQRGDLVQPLRARLELVVLSPQKNHELEDRG
jgi:hypothetical protein